MEVLGYEQACLISLCLLGLEQASCVRTACAADVLQTLSKLLLEGGGPSLWWHP